MHNLQILGGATHGDFRVADAVFVEGKAKHYTRGRAQLQQASQPYNPILLSCSERVKQDCRYLVQEDATTP